MEVIKINGRISNDEKEVNLLFDYGLKQWIMDTTVMKYYTKAKKQGWTQLKEYVYSDGPVVGGVFEAPAYSVSIRSTKKMERSSKQETDDEQCVDFCRNFDIIITIQNDWRLMLMYGVFWSIYWRYWADRREDEKKKK